MADAHRQWRSARTASGGHAAKLRPSGVIEIAITPDHDSRLTIAAMPYESPPLTWQTGLIPFSRLRSYS